LSVSFVTINVKLCNTDTYDRSCVRCPTCVRVSDTCDYIEIRHIGRSNTSNNQHSL